MTDERSSPSDHAPPAKRQRVLACRRCRSRKQRCDDPRPCLNCRRSGEECVPTAPAPRTHVETEYVRVLEERIAELESLDPQQSLDHIRVPSNGPSNETHPYVNSAVGHHSDKGHRRPSRSITDYSPNHENDGVDEDDSVIDHLVFGLVASPSVPRIDKSVTESETSRHLHQSRGQDMELNSHLSAASVPSELADLLLEAYRERAQIQYPFFHWDTFLQWHTEWSHCPPAEQPSRRWQGFFVNLVYATSLILLRWPSIDRFDAHMFYRNGISLLPSVLEKPDKVLHIQAFLLLAMRALHQSSTERIISLASTTIRYCVQQQLHLSDTEPPPLEPAVRLQNQIRRRCFWCAYTLDRLVMFSFDLPPSIPDSMITVQTFANIDDKDLLQVAANTAPGIPLADETLYTCVSPALHILQCRRIQSEISTITLRWDYNEHYESSPEWRIRILAELENYKSRVQSSSRPQSKGYNSQRWLAMIYHYTLLMLYRPTKQSVVGPAGDWSVQASCQACLIFRKSQMEKQIAQPWLGLLVQFQSGITLLYCFWATPPEHRTENYDSLDVPDALRACSNILAIMADRWAKADCLRDVFERLAREIPLVDRPNRPPTRLSEKAVSSIYENLPQVRALIVHRSILRMIEEMISEDFPRSRGNAQMIRPPSVAGMLAPSVTPLTSQPSSATPSAFQFPFSMQQPFTFDGAGIDAQDFSADDLPAFPGVFDFEAWD